MKGGAAIDYVAVDGTEMLAVMQMCGWRLWWFCCCCCCDMALWGVDVGSGGSDDMVVVLWVVMRSRWVDELPCFGPNARALDGSGCTGGGGSSGDLKENTRVAYGSVM